MTRSIDFPAFFKSTTPLVFGGPYRHCPKGMFGVKMAAEINLPCEVSIPTEDFSVPKPEDMSAGLTAILTQMVADPKTPIYVGCMGGIGRTGLCLALMAKVFGASDPVAYVREHYLGHAVETKAQQAYVKDFPLTFRQKWLAFRVKLSASF